MAGRRVQPALTDSSESAHDHHCAETDIATSANKGSLCGKRRRGSQSRNEKSQRRSHSKDCEVDSTFQPCEKFRTQRDGSKQSQCSVPCNNKDPRSNSSIASVDEQQCSDQASNATHGQRLLSTFFDQPCVELARNLLGKYLIRISDEDGKQLRGRIVETEAYVGIEDRASHSYGGRRTARNEAMYMPPGTSYVYNIYGIYTCINISSSGRI